MRNYYEYGHSRRRRKRLKLIPCLITLVAIGIVVGGLYFLLNMGSPDKYADYNQYNEKNKAYGTVEQYKKETKNFYISIYYPKFNNADLNKKIISMYKGYIDEQNKNKKADIDVLYMDYSVDYTYKQFITVKTKFIRQDMKNEKTTVTKQDVFTYDTKEKKVLELADCLRSNYSTILEKLNAANIDGTSTKIAVGKKDFTYYSDDSLKNFVKVNYSENKSSMRLNNKNIPSDLPSGIKYPTVQKVDPDKKMIAITMDDGPHKTLTDRAMKAFEKYKGRATFFELGQNVSNYPTVVKDVYERGFEIASHTYTHSQLTKLSQDKLNEEIQKTQDAVFKITGFDPVLIRPPYGAKNTTVSDTIKKFGLTTVLWDVDTLDWKNRNAQVVCDAIVNGAADGKIVLIHDIHETSIAGLELALPILAQKGYQFVSVSTLYQYKGVTHYK